MTNSNNQNQNQNSAHPGERHHHHHILPNQQILLIGGALLVLTAITVGVAQIDLGRLNFVVAMIVATIKALLVAMFFMNLKNDGPENAVIFGTSFLFLAIFIVFTSTDLFFRGDVYVKAGGMAPVGHAKSHFKKPWVSTPELVAHGKELFSQQCTSCHGDAGQGNGPAAGALNPPPRNFTQLVGWKNGRKTTMIFKTLKEGLPPSGMASFATLPAEDRWALAQYVLTLNSLKPEADTPADFAKIGVNPNDEGAGATEEAPTIPIELAMQRIAQPDVLVSGSSDHLSVRADHPVASGAGGKIYQSQCLQCHGAQAEGGIQVGNLGLNPRAFITTQALGPSLSTMQSEEAFRAFMVRGLPGRMMPGYGDLSVSEMTELYQYTRSLGSAAR